MIEERYELALDRIRLMQTEDTVGEPYRDYFKKMAEFVLMLDELRDELLDGRYQKFTLEELRTWNRRLYQDVLPGQYEKSYANPDYAVEQLGEEFGQLLCAYLAYIRRETGAAFRGDLMQLTIQMELFVEIYNRFEAGEEKDVPEKSAVQQDLYWFFHDYSEIFYEKSLRRLIDPAEDFENDIVMNADLNDLRYLYRYGVYIGENEKKMAAFLNRLTDEEIQAMAAAKGLTYRFLSYVEPQIVISKDHPLVREKKPMTRENLANYGFIRYMGQYDDIRSNILGPNEDGGSTGKKKEIYVTGRATLMNLISQTDFYSIGIHDFDKQLSDFRAVSVPIPGCEVKLEFGYVTLADVPISGIGEEFLKEVRERLERGQDV